MISKDKIVEAFAEVVEEVFSHPTASMDIRVKAEASRVPTMDVEYTVYIICEGED